MDFAHSAKFYKEGTQMPHTMIQLSRQRRFQIHSSSSLQIFVANDHLILTGFFKTNKLIA